MKAQPQWVIGVILTLLLPAGLAFYQGLSKREGIKVNVHVNVNGNAKAFGPIEPELNGAALVQKKIDLIDTLTVKQFNEFKDALQKTTDPKEALKFYAEDAVLFAGNKLYRGKAVLESNWKGKNTANLLNFFKKTQLRPGEVDGNDQVAYEKGHFWRNSTYGGIYLIVFKKKDGLYKVQAELLLQNSKNEKRSPSVNVHVGAPKGTTVHVGPHVNVSQQPHSTGDIEQQLANELLKYQKAVKDENFSEILNLYTNHAVILMQHPEEVHVHTGFYELLKYWKTNLADAKKTTYKSDHAGGFGNWAFDYGKYENSRKNENGFYLVIFHREDNMWKIHIDAFAPMEK